MFFGRIERSANVLPTHWAYGDEQQKPGFQVWASVTRAIAASAGLEDFDGDYSQNSGYQYVLQVECCDFEDGAGEWFSVFPENVQSVSSAPIALLLKDLIPLWEPLEDELEFSDWCEANEDIVLNCFEKHACQVMPVFESSF